MHGIMEKVSYSYTRQHLSDILNQINEDAEVYCIKRQNGKQVIMLDKEDYDSLLETNYLLKSPNNAKELEKGLEEAKKMEGRKIDF